MRLTSVDMFPADVEEPINFSLYNIDPSARYQIRNIVGIDAEDLIQKFYGSSTSGINYYDFSMKPRDIVFSVILNPHTSHGESASEVRDEIYRSISASRSGFLRFQFNSGATIVAQIYGYISKIEAAYFEKKPSVQITVRCNDPMFKAINPVQFTASNLDVMGNPVTIPDTLSTAPHGFVMEVVFTAPSATLTIQDTIFPEWMFKLQPIGGFLTGDVVHLNSNFSEKEVYIFRDPNIIKVANAIVVGSMWPLVFPFPATNTFYIQEYANVDWVSLEYYASYWGV